MRSGYCRCCWLAESEREELDGMLRAGRLPWGTLRRFGLRPWHSKYHRRHLGRATRMVYHAGEEWDRRRREGARLTWWRWKPGQCGGGRKPKGVPNRRPMSTPNGIAAAIRADREERRERWEAAKVGNW